MKRLVLFTSLLLSGTGLMAQAYQPVTLTGFNADVIANGSGAASASTTQAVDIANFSLVAANYVNPSNQSPTMGVPSTGLINSVATPGLTFQLAPFTGNNDLRIPATGTTTGTGTGTLTFSTPTVADKVYVLGLSGNGTSTVTITVTFTDATTQVFSAQTISDWFGGTGYAIQGIGRVNRTTSAIENPTNDPKIYQRELVLSAANKIKPIQSLTFNKTSTTGVLNILGISVQSAASTLPTDAGVTAITAPVTACNLTSQETITISVTNFGTAPQSNIPVSYTINTNPAVSETLAGPVAPNTTVTYSFATKANLSAPATYNLTARTNLAGDQLASNDSFSKTVINSGGAGTPTISPSGAAGICTGGSVLLTASTTAVNPTYAWFINGNIIPNANAATFNASALGSYTVTVTSGTCSATSGATTVSLNPTPARPTITRTGNTLTSSSATGNQWYLNGTMLAGATNQTLNLTANGNYTVIATISGCSSSASQAFAVSNITGINEETQTLKTEIYPNPTAGSFVVTLPEAGPVTLTLFDLTGKKLFSQLLTAPETRLELSPSAKGIYLVQLIREDKTITRKLIVE